MNRIQAVIESSGSPLVDLASGERSNFALPWSSTNTFPSTAVRMVASKISLFLRAFSEKLKTASLPRHTSEAGRKR